MNKCNITTDENTVEVQDDEPVYIELTVKEYKPGRSNLCRLFDSCRHKKTDEWIENFRQSHPECF